MDSLQKELQERQKQLTELEARMTDETLRRAKQRFEEKVARARARKAEGKE